MANLRTRVETMEKRITKPKSIYVGMIFPSYADPEEAKAVWIEKHGAPLEGQETMWIELVAMKAQE